MRKCSIFLWSVCIAAAAAIFVTQPTYAIAESDVVISQVQLGNEASVNNEFIEIYNNTSSPKETTNWCLYYVRTTQTQTKLTCFLPANNSVHIFLPSYSAALAISSQLALSVPSFGGDLTFSAVLSGTAGYVRLVNSGGVDADKVGWGSAATAAEGNSPAAVPSVGKVLQRKSSDVANVLQDTNVNSDDFESVLPRPIYTYGLVYEVQDICLNLDGIQSVVPSDYTLGAGGNCSPPIVDICSNLAGTQAIVPDGYKTGSAGECLLDLLPIKVTELLPNPYGTDSDNEFIELFNPNDTTVDLELYRLKTGIETQKSYTFPTGSSILPNSYVAFYNSVIPFTLTNTTSTVQVTTADDVLIDESLPYADAKDNEAWALIDGKWQYTNQLTPGNLNKVSLIESLEDIAEISILKSCTSDQYRSPETNRCRQIVASESALEPCKEGQYRSVETNRCRSLSSDVGALELCDANQERNPETNRCRLITASADTGLAACKEGQERNLTTNRCRNIVKLSAAAYPIETFAASSVGGPVGWLAFGVVGGFAVGYGVWEWRVEIVRALRKMRSFIDFKK